ncbi:hypothetical protein FHG87_024927, partial [Trinorchestia longiramus]
KELFSPREGAVADGRDRKMSSSAGGMKSKWMKAFKSLKTSSSSGHPAKDGDRRGGNRSGELSPPILDNSHYFQEYTYKKISACDVCHQILKAQAQQLQQQHKHNSCSSNTNTTAAAATQTQQLQQQHKHNSCSSNTNTTAAAATQTQQLQQQHKHNSCQNIVPCRLHPAM